MISNNKLIKTMIFLFFAALVLPLSIVSCREQTLLSDGVEYGLSHPGAKIGSFRSDNITMKEGADKDLSVVEVIPIVKGFKITKGQFQDRIKLSWSPAVYGSSLVAYHVYRSLDGVLFTRITKDKPISASSYEEVIYRNKIEPGKVYYYAIRVVVPSLLDESGKILSSHLTDVKNGFTFNRVLLFSATQREFTDRIKLSWGAVDGASYYILKRALSDAEGNAPTSEFSYHQVGDALIVTHYDDLSIELQGDLVAQNSYWYRVYAVSATNIVSSSSPAVKGALLMVGTPGIVEILDVSDALFTNAIRIMWKANSATKYTINRITQENIAAGDLFGKIVNINPANFVKGKMIDIGGKSVTYCYYYDTASSILDGKLAYYRISGENDIGLGRSTLFATTADRELTKGSVLGAYAGTLINTAVQQDGFLISWPICHGASGYQVLRSEVDPSTDDTQWKFIATSNALNYKDPLSNMPTGFVMESGILWYKIRPINNAFVTINEGVSTVNKSFVAFNADTPLDLTALEAEITALGSLTTSIGVGDYSAYDSDFTVPVPDFSVAPTASQDADAYVLPGSHAVTAQFILPPDTQHATVRVSGKVADLSGIDKLNLKITRTCYYGDESGVHPRQEPRPSIGGVTFSKKGQELIKSVEVFDLKPSLNTTTGEFSFLDPMHDFRDGELIPDPSESDGWRKTNWLYAHWDREAWKFIKRQLPFDMNKAVKIQYRVSIERQGDPNWDPTVVTCVGWPALTVIESAQMACFFKDVALNRQSVMILAKYAESVATKAFLNGASQSVRGEYNKKIGNNGRSYLVAANGNSITIRNGIRDNYSDWPGIVINSYNRNNQFVESQVSFAITDLGKDGVTQGWVNIHTPLYHVVMYWYFWVYNRIYQYGISPSYRKSPSLSYANVWYQSRGVQRIPGIKILGFENTGGVTPYGYEAWDDYPRKSMPGGEDFYTRINLKYNPYPHETDFGKEIYPVMYYGYNY